VIELTEPYRPFTMLGLALIVIGVILVIIPLVVKHAPALERVPPIVLYIYRHDNFYFATSPILIIASIIFLLAYLLGVIR
jgi:hypothetical protein